MCSIPPEYERLVSSLEKEFVERFINTGLSLDLLRELVYGMDNLDYMTKVTDFPNGFLIRTADMEKASSSAKAAIKAIAIITKDNGWVLKPRSKKLRPLISEFFSYNYVKTFHTVLNALGDSELTIQVDGRAFSLKFYPLDGVLDDLGILEYRDPARDRKVRIPFSKTRFQRVVKEVAL